MIHAEQKNSNISKSYSCNRGDLLHGYFSDAVFFHEGWLEKVQAYDETANWRVKANNLRKIFRRITEFYKERLSKELGPEWTVDASRIGLIYFPV